MSKQKILIFPFGGNGREALTILSISRSYKDFDFLGYLDDNFEDLKDLNSDILGTCKSWYDYKDDCKLLAVPGNPNSFKERVDVIDKFNLNEFNSTSIISDTVSFSPKSVIGYNTLIMHGCYIGDNVTVGNNCVILPNTVISHDVKIDDHVLIGSNVSVSGNVRIGYNSYIGSAVSIIGGIEIGARALVGIGSNVISDVEANMTVVGNPAYEI
tara:strand:+ start:377 stop:1015 length:639 start_codon:yes stop_codon:yes gene_type:complete